jgi:hypothetical protein
MTMSAFNENYDDYPSSRILHARRYGSIAATMIGASAIVILGLASIFASPKGSGQPAAPEFVQAQARVEPPPASEKFTLRPSTTTGGAKGAPFDLTLPELAKLKKDFSTAARERGGRDDILTIGEFAARAPYVRLVVERAEGEKLNSDFFLDMSRLAAQAGLAVLRVAPPSPLASRFGAVDAAEIRLTQGPLEAASGASDERSCLAFRLVNQKISMETAGLACGSAAAPIDRRSLSCILDRIDFASGSGDKAVDQFFGGPAVDPAQACVASKTAPAAEGPTKSAKVKRSTSRR